MTNRMTQLSTVLCVAMVFGFAGCSGKSTQSTSSGGGEREHAHASAGPHGGSLIELGEEEYHAELVHDDATGTVTVYLLDSAAKASVPIDAREVVINLKHEGRGEQFKLAALSNPNDSPGKSSRFVSKDAELAADLDREGAEAQIAVTINSKPFRGAIEHHHGHDEDDHEHAHE